MGDIGSFIHQIKTILKSKDCPSNSTTVDLHGPFKNILDSYNHKHGRADFILITSFLKELEIIISEFSETAHIIHYEELKSSGGHELPQGYINYFQLVCEFLIGWKDKLQNIETDLVYTDELYSKSSLYTVATRLILLEELGLIDKLKASGIEGRNELSRMIAIILNANPNTLQPYLTSLGPTKSKNNPIHKTSIKQLDNILAGFNLKRIKIKLPK